MGRCREEKAERTGPKADGILKEPGAEQRGGASNCDDHRRRHGGFTRVNHAAIRKHGLLLFPSCLGIAPRAKAVDSL